jgi:hypothetical protein
MKKILILCAAMALVASPAFAIGIDLTVNACGNNAGSSGDAGALDCVGGGSVTLLGAFQPAEIYNTATNGGLVGVDMIFDMQVAGTLSSSGTAAFWDWDQVDGCNSTTTTTALSINHKAPAAGCTGYLNVWNVSNAAAGAAAGRRSLNTQRIAALIARPSTNPANTVVDQKLFGIQLLIDGSQSLESGLGVCGGCPVAAGIVWNSCVPATFQGGPTIALTGPSLAGNCVGINSGGNLCAAVPTRRHTWGQLKSLYR